MYSVNRLAFGTMGKLIQPTSNDTNCLAVFASVHVYRLDMEPYHRLEEENIEDTDYQSAILQTPHNLLPYQSRSGSEDSPNCRIQTGHNSAMTDISPNDDDTGSPSHSQRQDQASDVKTMIESEVSTSRQSEEAEQMSALPRLMERWNKEQLRKERFD